MQRSKELSVERKYKNFEGKVLSITDLDKIDLPELSVLPQKKSFQLHATQKTNLFKFTSSRSMFRFKSGTQSPVE
jgi:hypothetical protein